MSNYYVLCICTVWFAGSSEAAGYASVQPQRRNQGRQNTDEAEDGGGPGRAEEEAAGPGEGVGEGVPDVRGQAEQTGGGLPSHRPVQVRGRRRGRGRGRERGSR